MPKVLRITTFLVKPTFHVEMRYQAFTGTLCKQFFLLSQKLSLTWIELECNFICSEAREVFFKRREIILSFPSEIPVPLQCIGY